MTPEEVYRFLNSESLAVFSSVAETGQPQSALMGFAVTPSLELIFDTVKSSRKYPNLKGDPRIAAVVGCTTEVTVQYEGIAEELTGEGRESYLRTYFEKFPDGPARLSWPGIVHFVVRPKWLRFSDYNTATRRIEEMRF